MIRLDGGLFFATAEALDERIREIISADPPLTALVIDLEGVAFIDSQGAAKLTELVDLTEAEGVALRMARIKPRVVAVLKAEGILDRIGPTTSTATSTGPWRRNCPRAQTTRREQADSTRDASK